jgi:hypothetical protein
MVDGNLGFEKWDWPDYARSCYCNPFVLAAVVVFATRGPRHWESSVFTDPWGCSAVAIEEFLELTHGFLFRNRSVPGFWRRVDRMFQRLLRAGHWSACPSVSSPFLWMPSNCRNIPDSSRCPAVAQASRQQKSQLALRAGSIYRPTETFDPGHPSIGHDLPHPTCSLYANAHSAPTCHWALFVIVSCPWGHTPRLKGVTRWRKIEWRALFRQLHRRSLVDTVGKPPLDTRVLALDVAEFAHSKAECAKNAGIEWIGPGTLWQETDAPDFALLLRDGTERRCERTRAKRDDQFAAFVHLRP